MLILYYGCKGTNKNSFFERNLYKLGLFFVKAKKKRGKMTAMENKFVPLHHLSKPKALS